MRIRVSAFIVGKAEVASLKECQDAIWALDEALPRLDDEIELGNSCQEICGRAIELSSDSLFRFAVADGVTTAFYSGSWARLLVSRFGDQRLSIWDTDQFVSWQQDASQAWLAYMHSQDRQLGMASQNRLNEREPAASTFCGIEISGGETEATARWRARVIGDSCIFHLTNTETDDQILYSYPYESAAEFSRTTKGLTSYLVQDAGKFAETELKQPVLREGDLLILATDALSEWLLKMHERGYPVWKTIAELDGREAFGTLIANARRERESTRHLKDDDVALIVISTGDGRLGPLQDEWVYEPGDLLPPFVPSIGPSEFDKFLASLMVPATSLINEDQSAEPSPPEPETDEENQDAELNPEGLDDVNEKRQGKPTPLIKCLVISLTKQLCRLGRTLKNLASMLRPKSKVSKPVQRVEANL